MLKYEERAEFIRRMHKAILNKIKENKSNTLRKIR